MYGKAHGTYSTPLYTAMSAGLHRAENCRALRIEQVGSPSTNLHRATNWVALGSGGNCWCKAVSIKIEWLGLSHLPAKGKGGLGNPPPWDVPLTGKLPGQRWKWRAAIQQNLWSQAPAPQTSRSSNWYLGSWSVKTLQKVLSVQLSQPSVIQAHFLGCLAVWIGEGFLHYFRQMLLLATASVLLPTSQGLDSWWGVFLTQEVHLWHFGKAQHHMYCF